MATNGDESECRVLYQWRCTSFIQSSWLFMAYVSHYNSKTFGYSFAPGMWALYCEPKISSHLSDLSIKLIQTKHFTYF